MRFPWGKIRWEKSKAPTPPPEQCRADLLPGQKRNIAHYLDEMYACAVDKSGLDVISPLAAQMTIDAIAGQVPEFKKFLSARQGLDDAYAIGQFRVVRAGNRFQIMHHRDWMELGSPFGYGSPRTELDILVGRGNVVESVQRVETVAKAVFGVNIIHRYATPMYTRRG